MGKQKVKIAFAGHCAAIAAFGASHWYFTEAFAVLFLIHMHCNRSILPRPHKTTGMAGPYLSKRKNAFRYPAERGSFDSDLIKLNLRLFHRDINENFIGICNKHRFRNISYITY